MGNAKTEANYHAYYQTLIKDGTANGATSNAYLTSSNVPLRPNASLRNTEQAPYIIKNMRYCSNSQQVKLAPLCPQVDSALHILSGCQQTQIRNMITERHNVACRMIFEAISKTGSLGSCIVSMDIGSNERMTMQNLQILEQLKLELFPNGSSHPASQIKTYLPPAAQVLCWLLPSLQKHKNNKLM